MLQEAVGKAPGAAPDIKTNPSLNIQTFQTFQTSKLLKRPFEFFSAAGNEAGRSLNLNLNLNLDLSRRLGLDLTADADLSLEDERLRARPRIGKPAFDQQEIQPRLHLQCLRNLMSRISSREKLCMMPGLTSTSTRSPDRLIRTPR